MKYVGVDVAKADHCLGAIDAQGQVVLKPVRFTQDAAGFAALERHLRSLGSPAEVVVGMEATGHYWVLLAEEVQRLGYRPQVFNPILTGDAARTSVRGRKTDADDCLAIAKVLRDGKYHAVRMPDASFGELKALCRHRQAAVERVANLKKRFIGLLDLVFPEFQKLFAECHGPTARAVLAKAPSARLMTTVTAAALTRLMDDVSRGRLGNDRAQQVVTAAKTSIARARIDTASELAIQCISAEIDLIDQHIATYDARIDALAPAGRELLMSIPGIGAITAAVILAEIITIDRFVRRPGERRHDGRRAADGIHRLLAFAGLDPRVRESGQWKGKTHMSKRGSRTLRTALWRAAFVAKKHEAFRDLYHRHRVAMGQNHKIALSHVASKLVQAVYGVLRHQTDFDLNALRGTPRSAA